MKFITQLKLPHNIKSGGEKKVHDKKLGMKLLLSFDFKLL